MRKFRLHLQNHTHLLNLSERLLLLRRKPLLLHLTLYAFRRSPQNHQRFLCSGTFFLPSKRKTKLARELVRGFNSQSHAIVKFSIFKTRQTLKQRTKRSQNLRTKALWDMSYYTDTCTQQAIKQALKSLPTG